MGRQNEMEQEIEFQPFNGTPSSRVVNNTTLTRTFYTPTSGIIYACVIVLLLFSNCILLGRVASGIQGTNSELQVQKQILQTSPPPPLQENFEYKTLVWKIEVISAQRSGTSFVEVMESEGVSEDEFSDCSYPERYNGGVADDWERVSTFQRACVLAIVVDKLAKENWRLINEPQYWNNLYGAITFTRTTYTV
jgi:hypothetical protein